MSEPSKSTTSTRHGPVGRTVARGPVGPVLAVALVGTALIGAAGPAAAEGALDRIRPRLERAMAEQRVFLICASLDKAWATDTRETWDEVRGTGRAWLKANGATSDELDRFEAMTTPERLLVDMPLFRAIELCTVTHPDWVERFTGFRYLAKIDGTPPPAD